MRNYAFALLTMISATSVFAGPGEQDAVARLKDAGLVMHEIMAAPDKGIPEEVLHDAKCIAVIPNMAKGAFLVGGEHGRGVVTCRAGHGWSAPAFLSIGGGNFGFQAGAQSVDLVMLFMNDKGVQGLLSSKFELTGEASAAAGPVGRHASAGTDWKMNTEALSYSRTKGLFAGVAIDGAVIQQDNDSTVAFYGKKVSFQETLSGNVHAPASSNSFLSAVRAADSKASQHEAAEKK
jgi:lipid-binding SYLF domain-containing protein